MGFFQNPYYCFKWRHVDILRSVQLLSSVVHHGSEQVSLELAKTHPNTRRILKEYPDDKTRSEPVITILSHSSFPSNSNSTCFPTSRPAPKLARFQSIGCWAQEQARRASPTGTERLSAKSSGNGMKSSRRIVLEPEPFLADQLSRGPTTSSPVFLHRRLSTSLHTRIPISTMNPISTCFAAASGKASKVGTYQRLGLCNNRSKNLGKVFQFGVKGEGNDKSGFWWMRSEEYDECAYIEGECEWDGWVFALREFECGGYIRGIQRQGEVDTVYR
ncbi:hypothetical protein BDP27DRAFT_1362046 [Rhodocollybia butyracea]|uniref:Uncharacterized protein n=1 Tax=Rhodocollybia butyracea TaxID=206335 RepID=A0A9P5PZT8_9AGAR|nr:hypothetical protein BDP27DRAFT_1362046 [Rhodocollybia butyracea]